MSTQTSLFETAKLQHADWYLDPHFFDTVTASTHLTTLINSLDWQHYTLKLFGKVLPQPRLTAFYGDEGIAYAYSGLTLQALPYTDLLKQIQTKIEAAYGVKFNCVLANYYRDGNDSMGWHSDDEPSLGPDPVIASVSFGAERCFHLRHRFEVQMPTQKLRLNNGSLLMMQGKSQSHWQHQLPKSKKVSGPRVNLTFRRIVS
jgi:alkylated DNA repair dioxygenase AlkB